MNVTYSDPTADNKFSVCKNDVLANAFYRPNGNSHGSSRGNAKASAEVKSKGNVEETLDDRIRLLKTAPFFSELDDQALRRLAIAAIASKYRKQTVVFSEGDNPDGLYFIQSGSVKIFVSDEQGHEFTLFVENVTGCFGEASLIDGTSRTASVQVLENTVLLFVPKAFFLQCVEHNPEVLLKVVSLTTQRLRRATDSLRSLALKNVYQRLTQKLQELALEVDGNLVLPRKFSQQEIANMIGSSREMVSKLMSDLTKGGYIGSSKGILEIHRKMPHAW